MAVKQNKVIANKMYKNCILEWVFHTEDDIMEAIDSLDNGAVCGPNGWKALMIKRLKIPLARFLTVILRTSLREGRFPTNLKNAFITGIFKCGEKDEAANYHPIALTSHISKIMEKVIRKDIVNYLDNNDL